MVEGQLPEKNKNTEEKTKLSTLVLISAGFCGVMTFLLMRGDHSNTALLIFFILACGLGFMVRPAVVMWENRKKRHIRLLEKILLGIRMMLVSGLIQAFYIVFISSLYDLYWSYWGLLVSFILLLGIEKMEKNINPNEKEQEDIEEEEEETEGRAWKRVKRIVGVLISAALFHYQVYIPASTLNTEDLILPYSIRVSLLEDMEEDTQEHIYRFLSRKRTIIMEETTDKELIEDFWEEIQQGSIENLRYIPLLNYSKLASVYDESYTIYVNYDGTRRNLEEQGELIDAIHVYPNGRVYLSRYGFGTRRFETYPVIISTETLGKLNIFL